MSHQKQHCCWKILGTKWLLPENPVISTWIFSNLAIDLSGLIGRMTLLCWNSPFSTSVSVRMTRFRSFDPHHVNLKILQFVHLSVSKLFSSYDDAACRLHFLSCCPMWNSGFLLFSQSPLSPITEVRCWVYGSISSRTAHLFQVAQMIAF